MTLAPLDLRTDGRRDPLGLGSDRPEFRWQLAEGIRAQAATELEVSENADFSSPVWASGKTPGSEPFGHRYAGQRLASARRYHWRVRIWADATTEPSAWATATFETGILNADEWVGKWVAGPTRGPKEPPSVLYLRGSVDFEAAVVRARAFVSSLGWHRFLVNGEDLTGPALVPRWTALDKEVEYIAYDVTSVLKSGRNVIGLAIGDGRYRGTNGYENHTRIYGDRLAGLVQLMVELDDGTVRTVGTDDSWVVGTGRILESDPKLGERVDLRIDDSWESTLDTPLGFRSGEVIEHPRVLIGEGVERVRQVGLLPAVSITPAKNGAHIVDFGQNFAGVVRLRLPASAGTEVTLTYSEVLKKDGSLDLDYIHLSPFGRWYQRDTVTLAASATEWQPWFTIHGFRYVEITGLPEDVGLEDVTGVVISTDLDWVGEFECSDDRLNRLWENVAWSVRSNFMDTSTDCPTRERSGWTGDIQAFAPTAANMIDAQWFLRRFLHNLRLEQADDGTIPAVIPSGFSEFSGGPRGHLASAGTAAGWSDASVLVPWMLFQYYGDERVLADQYDSMVAWVESCARRARETHKRRTRQSDPDLRRYVLDTGFQFGEWLRPGEGPVRSAMDAARRGAVVATAYFEHSARLLASAAAILGHTEDHDHYLALAESVRNAWRATFLHADGRIGTDRQDDYVRALAFDLLNADEKPDAAARLIAHIEAAGGHLGTGFLSTPLLLGTLVDSGHADVAWNLLLATSSPSWLYQVANGATTVWETWEGYTKTGKAKMSHNHYALGSVARFLPERIAGITPRLPGYRAMYIHPLIGGGLTSARARLRTPFGIVESSWRLADGWREYTVSIPPGTTGSFRAEGDADELTLEPGTHTIRRPEEI